MADSANPAAIVFDASLCIVQPTSKERAHHTHTHVYIYIYIYSYIFFVYSLFFYMQRCVKHIYIYIHMLYLVA